MKYKFKQLPVFFRGLFSTWNHLVKSVLSFPAWHGDGYMYTLENDLWAATSAKLLLKNFCE